MQAKGRKENLKFKERKKLISDKVLIV